MQTIGERLLEARQRRGVSIREAAEATKVRGDYLTAMESNQFDTIPLADVYKRGFLKIYAKFLRLDCDRLVHEYNGLLAARIPHGSKIRRATDLIEGGSPRPIEPRETDSSDEFASGAIELAERPDNRRKLILTLGLSSLTIIVIAAIAIRGCSGPAPAQQQAQQQQAAAPVSAEGEVTLTCRAEQAVPVRLVRLSDESPVFEKTLKPGESAVVKGTGKYELYANPLDKIHFSVNGGPALSFKPGFTKGPLEIPAKSK